MAVKTYLQSAISQVQAAMADMESQMHCMQQQVDSEKSRITNECMHLEQERVRHEIERDQSSDDQTRNALHQRVVEINRKIDAEKAHLAQMESNLAQARQRKDQLHTSLYNAIGELTRLSALPDIG